MAFDEDVNLRVTADTPATAELRELGRAASDAQDAVNELDAESVTVDVSAPGLDDIEGSAGRASRGLDDIDGAAGRASAGLEGVRDKGDKSRSVMANLVGNSAQDLGALGGVAGSTGMAIGQLGEYAAEGDISLRNLATGGVAMVGVGLALSAVMQGFAEDKRIAQEIDAFNTKQVEDFTKALREGKTEAEALNDELRETETVMTPFNLLGFQGVTDATGSLVSAGETIDSFNTKVNDSEFDIDAWRESLVEAGVPIGDVTIAVAALETAKANLATATQAAEDREKFFGEALDKSGEKVDANAEKVGDAVRQYAALKAAVDGLNASLAVLQGRFALAQSSGALAAGVTIQNNFHASSPTPKQVEDAAYEWQRVQVGPQ